MITEITQIIMKNSVMFGITIAVLSTFVNQLVLSFINDIIMPVIDRDGNDDNQPDINKIADYKIKAGGITFRIGAFILALIRFILLLFILFILCLVIIKINNNNNNSLELK
jgi:large-conductance mechanosensitive channel